MRLMGAIAGDMIGSRFEWHAIKSEDFQLFDADSHFTDDTVITLAVAEAVLGGGYYARWMQDLGRRYPSAGYGGKFREWLVLEEPAPYGSLGNGSAMRASPIGWAFDTPEDVLAEAERSAAVSHNHPEGIKGAQAAALAVFLARQRASKEHIRAEITARFGYDLRRSVAQIRPTYHFDVTCPGSVPEALICFLEANSYEDAVRKAVSLGGDADTQACIAGSIAEAFWGVPEKIEQEAFRRLPDDLKEIVERFNERTV